VAILRNPRNLSKIRYGIFKIFFENRNHSKKLVYCKPLQSEDVQQIL
jgi:hypothetical protein